MLPPLQDYVFLTDRDTFNTFMVERDGEVWALPPAPAPVFQPDHRQPALLKFNVTSCNAISYRWRDGWLPVLEIRTEGHLLEMHAADGVLHTRRDESEAAFYDQEGAHVLSSDAFEEGARNMARVWQAFFQGTPQPAPLEGEEACAWRATIVQGLLAGCGNHPKYGVGSYHDRIHDGFPPATIPVVDLLLELGHAEEACARMACYLERFVLADGSLDYYGPSLAEYGMLLELCARCVATPFGGDWLAQCREPLLRMVRQILRFGNPLVYQEDASFPGLLAGVPEADTKDRPAIYVHNNAWIVRGLEAWSRAAASAGLRESAAECALEAERLRRVLRAALTANAMADGLPPYRLPSEKTIGSFNDTRDTTYANYRYYPELLESGFLTRDEAMAVVRAREERDGEAEGMTRFHFAAAFPTLTALPAFCADGWPIASYGYALADLGERVRLEKTIHGHYLNHQSRDTFTAYESVEIDGGGACRRAVTDWCVPAQLAYPRMLLKLRRLFPVGGA